LFWRIWYADLVTGPSRMNAFCVEKHGNCLIFAPGNASVGRSFSVYIWLWLICPKQNGRDSGCVHAEDMICGLVERLWWGFLPPSSRRDYRSVCLFSIYLIDPWLFLHVLCLQFKSHFALKLAGTTPYIQLLIMSWDKQFNMCKGWLLISSEDSSISLPHLMIKTWGNISMFNKILFRSQ